MARVSPVRRVRLSEGGSSTGKKVLIGSILAVIVVAVLTLLLGQPKAVRCSGEDKDPVNCGCPVSPSHLKARNLLVIDVTDPIPPTKFEDIKRIVNEFSTKPEDLFPWVFNGKMVTQTSVYLLTDKPPSIMEPAAVFCSQAPSLSFTVFGDSSRLAVEKAQRALVAKTERALDQLKRLSGASQSPIVETLATLTSNSSAWSPNGSLTLISDLHENSNMCGYLEHQPSVDKFPRGLGKQCMATIEQLGTNLTNIRVGLPSVAICELPGKPLKPGLKQFWRDMFQSLTRYEPRFSCAPEELLDQKRHVGEIYKRLQSKSNS